MGPNLSAVTAVCEMHNYNLGQAICVYLESSLVHLLARMSPKEPRSCVAWITAWQPSCANLSRRDWSGYEDADEINRQKQRDRSDEEAPARRRGPPRTALTTRRLSPQSVAKNLCAVARG